MVVLLLPPLLSGIAENGVDGVDVWRRWGGGDLRPKSVTLARPEPSSSTLADFMSR